MGCCAFVSRSGWEERKRDDGQLDVSSTKLTYKNCQMIPSQTLNPIPNLSPTLSLSSTLSPSENPNPNPTRCWRKSPSHLSSPSVMNPSQMILLAHVFLFPRDVLHDVEVQKLSKWTDR